MPRCLTVHICTAIYTFNMVESDCVYCLFSILQENAGNMAHRLPFLRLLVQQLQCPVFAPRCVAESCVYRSKRVWVACVCQTPYFPCFQMVQRASTIFRTQLLHTVCWPSQFGTSHVPTLLKEQAACCPFAPEFVHSQLICPNNHQ